MFKLGWSIEGLWCGPTFAVALNTFIYMHVINQADWQTIANEHEEKMKKIVDDITPAKEKE